ARQVVRREACDLLVQPRASFVVEPDRGELLGLGLQGPAGRLVDGLAPLSFGEDDLDTSHRAHTGSRRRSAAAAEDPSCETSAGKQVDRSPNYPRAGLGTRFRRRPRSTPRTGTRGSLGTPRTARTSTARQRRSCARAHGQPPSPPSPTRPRSAGACPPSGRTPRPRRRTRAEPGETGAPGPSRPAQLPRPPRTSHSPRSAPAHGRS